MKKEYTILFNSITDALEQMKKTIAHLEKAQIDAEETVISQEKGNLRPL